MFLKNNPILFLLRTLWRFSYGFRKDIVLATSMFVIANLFLLSDPLIIGHLLNLVQTQGLTSASISPILWTLVAVFLTDALFWAFHAPARVIERRTAYRASIAYKSYLLNGVMRLPAQWHTDHHSGDTIDKIEKSSRALYDFSEHTFEVIQVVVRMIAAYTMVSLFHPPSSIIVLVVFFAMFFTVKGFDTVLIKKYAEFYKMENTVSAKVYDVISNITTVIILRIEKLVHSSIVKKMQAPFSLYMRTSKINEMKWNTTSLIASILTLLILGSYLYMNYRAGNVILVGTLSVLYGYLMRINDEFFRVTYLYSDIVRQKTSVQNVEEISNEFGAITTTVNEELSKTWNTIKVDNLSFSYHTQEGADVHLDDVAFSIKRGEKIALVGHSGAGKTTLLKVIRGLYVPQSVTVSVDGKTLPQAFGSMSESIALVPQDPEIFATTILENITVGVEQPQEKVERFVRMAQFTDVVARLPHGYDSSIVEKGVNLSGGEKQRLALARGLLASEHKDILLLDEPTSSVDPHNERAVYTHIFSEFHDLTVISSIHRLHLLPLFDRVFFFENGQIIGEGHYTELIKTCEPFAAAWNEYTKSLHHGQES